MRHATCVSIRSWLRFSQNLANSITTAVFILIDYFCMHCLQGKLNYLKFIRIIDYFRHAMSSTWFRPRLWWRWRRPFFRLPMLFLRRTGASWRFWMSLWPCATMAFRHCGRLIQNVPTVGEERVTEEWLSIVHWNLILETHLAILPALLKLFKKYPSVFPTSQKLPAPLSQLHINKLNTDFPNVIIAHQKIPFKRVKCHSVIVVYRGTQWWFWVSLREDNAISVSLHSVVTTTSPVTPSRDVCQQQEQHYVCILLLPSSSKKILKKKNYTQMFTFDFSLCLNYTQRMPCKFRTWNHTISLCLCILEAQGG